MASHTPDLSTDGDPSRDDLLSVRKTLRGQRILLTGSTGFLGKVYASMVLTKHPDIEQLYLVIRARRGGTAHDRFIAELADSGAFDPLREIYGDGLYDFLNEKVTVLSGDVTDDYFGLPLDEAKALSAVVDVIVNSAGLTNFNPNLANALDINTHSSRRMLEFIRLGGSRARLLHVSTAYVAGRTVDPTPEVLPGPTVYPRYEELEVPFDAQRELADCERMIAHAHAQCDDQERHSQLTAEARQMLKDANRNVDNEALFAQAYDEAKHRWIRRRLSDDGRQRAEHWGWVNIYTYTKSLGERLIVDGAGDDVVYTLFRPAIIESSQTFPKRGWNEGINTTAPIIYLDYKGHRFVPTQADRALDVIPIDMTVGAMLAMTAALIEGRHADVYHLGSSDRNRLSMPRIVELTTLATRRLIDSENRNPIEKRIRMSLDAVPVTQEVFNRQSLPGYHKVAQRLGQLIDRTPTQQMGSVGKSLKSIRRTIGKVERLADTGSKFFEIFKPFIYDNRYTFLARNIEALAAQLVPEERELYGCPIAELDWRDYWLNIHVPGLAKYVFPHLEEKLATHGSDHWTYENLVDLFDASTHNFADRVALRHHDRGIVESYSYSELQQFATRGAEALAARGIGTGHTVLIVAENRPQWGMTYFAILKSGATAVPVDPDANVDKLTRIATSAGAAAIVMSEAVFERVGAELADTLEAPAPLLMTFDALFDVATDEEVEQALVPMRFTSERDVASLIYTSGTTGEPKGVMLTHRNFTSLLGSLEGAFRVDERDGFLSVLPLHHTFEFSAGFLMPLSRGSSITYVEEVSGEELRAAMKASRVTALIGVPALWQLLHRRIEQNTSSGPAFKKWLFDRLVSFNRTLRKRTGMNLGALFFAPVHDAFGGRIKYLISGGSALPADILEAFYGLGFDLYEGYGLTEAAPVLTVNRPQDGLAPGSVGKPLPGIEVEIRDPNDEGVGEVVARGDNVMLGYLGRDEETAQTIRDGWLHTGDLGKLDRRGRLSIVGRRKEVIVTTGGKNVYPDELEELYGRCPGVLELSVVGLPDEHGNERVACLVHPEVHEGSPTEIAEARTAIRDWFRVEGARVAPHERITILKFWDEELPRTPTRKVKRSAVIEILQRLQAVSGDAVAADSWLAQVVAELAGVDSSKVHAGAHFADDLAFDSLMTVELAAVLAEREVHLTPEQLAEIQTFAELEDAVENGVAVGALVKSSRSTLDRVDEIPVPTAVAKIGKSWLYRAQMKSYEDLFNVEVYGQANIPYHNPNVIVVSNHVSHLDMGLVKYALGDFGTDIRALAAADYFYSNVARKTYFKNFTNLIPIERAGTPDIALRGAARALQNGETLLMFPEGTRSPKGKLREFKRGLGYLVQSQRVNILPVHLSGTYEALPKGRSLPHPTRRDLKVRIGKVLDARTMLAAANEQGLSGGQLWEFIAKSAHAAVAELAAIGEPKGEDGLLDSIFGELNDKFEHNQVEEETSFYFSLGNVDEAKWTVIVDPTQCVIRNGKPSGGTADCVVKTTPELFRRIVQESYVPSFDEFMSGVIKTNSPDLLIRFQSVFGLQR